MKLLKISLIIIIVLALSTVSQASRLDRAEITVQVRIPHFIEIEITGPEEEQLAEQTLEESISSTLTFTENEILQAFQEQEGEEIIVEKELPHLLTTRANFGFLLQLSARDEYFRTRDGGASIPVSRLEWKLNIDEEWRPLSKEGIDSDILTVIEQPGPGISSTDLHFRLNVSLQDTVGIYDGLIYLTVEQ